MIMFFRTAENLSVPVNQQKEINVYCGHGVIHALL